MVCLSGTMVMRWFPGCLWQTIHSMSESTYLPVHFSYFVLPLSTRWRQSKWPMRSPGCIRIHSETLQVVKQGCATIEARNTNPVTTVECISLSIRAYPGALTFITHILCINRTKITFVWLDLVYFCYIFFNFAIFFMPFMINVSETRHSKTRGILTFWQGVFLLCLQQFWEHLTPLWRHAVWICIMK